MSQTQKSFAKLTAALGQASDEVKMAFAFSIGGRVVMGIAIIFAFGWAGALFDLGFIVWALGEGYLEP